jgi:hypothetical protein
MFYHVAKVTHVKRLQFDQNSKKNKVSNGEGLVYFVHAVETKKIHQKYRNRNDLISSTNLHYCTIAVQI